MWKYSVDWTEDFYTKNKDLMFRNYEKKYNNNPWNCNLHTHGNHEVFHDEDMEDIDYEHLKILYDELLNRWSKDINIFVPMETESIWYNIYTKGQFQEPHDHMPGEYVGVHFIRLLESHPKLSFSDGTIPDVSQGDVLIFPASKEHYVPKSEIEEPRITIAFSWCFQ